MTDTTLASRALAANAGPLRGLWLTILTANVLELMPTDGIDWLGVDLQHGYLEVRDLPEILRVATVPVLARAGSHDPDHLARILDTGVHGVIVPGVSSEAEVSSLVTAVRMPPEGRRSSGLARTTVVGGPAHPLLLPMIETRDGLANLTDIAAHPGIDGLFVGPYDLSLSLSRPSVIDAEVVAAIGAVVAATRQRGLLAGAYSGNRSLDPLLPHLDLLAVDTDLTVLRLGVGSLFSPTDRT